MIRKATGQTKASRSISRGGSVEFTEDALAILAADQEALRRELRNVQSKRSIMKSKEGFSESDARWLALLKAEEQLKSIRVAPTKATVYIDETKNLLASLLAGVDADSLAKMKAADAKALLTQVLEMAGDHAETAETTEDENN